MFSHSGMSLECLLPALSVPYELLGLERCRTVWTSASASPLPPVALSHFGAPLFPLSFCSRVLDCFSFWCLVALCVVGVFCPGLLLEFQLGSHTSWLSWLCRLILLVAGR